MGKFKDVPLVPVPRNEYTRVSCQDCGRDYFADGERADVSVCSSGVWRCAADNEHYPGERIAWVTPEKKTELAIKILEN